MRPMEVLQKVAAPAFAVALGLTACGSNNGETLRPKSEATTTTTTVDISDGCENPDMNAAAQQRAGEELGGVYVGFKAGEVKIGCDDVDFEANPREASDTASFTQEEQGVLDTQDEIAAFFKSDNERAVKARERVIKSMQDENLPQSEIDRAMSGECYVPIQATVPTVIEGTTYFVDGEILQAAGRLTGKNDIYWFCFTENGDLVKGASLRADCSNPDVNIIRPRRPGEKVPGIDKVPVPTKDQSVPNAPGSGGEREEGMDSQNDSNKDGYGPGDTHAVNPTPETTTTFPDTAPDGSTPVTGPEGTGPDVPLDPGDGTPDTDDVPSEPIN